MAVGPWVPKFVFLKEDGARRTDRVHFPISTGHNPSLRPHMARVLAFAALVLALASGKLIKLDQGNFEMKTQASSGEYSGYWVVCFCDQSKRCGKVLDAMGALANEMKRTNKGLVFAWVDYADSGNQRLLERFGVRAAPTLIFIEQAHFAAYTRNTFSKRKIKSFAETHARGAYFRRVPRPKDVIERTIGPYVDAVMLFVYTQPIAQIMSVGLPEMPAKIVWALALYVAFKVFHEKVWIPTFGRAKTKKKQGRRRKKAAEKKSD